MVWLARVDERPTEAVSGGQASSASAVVARRRRLADRTVAIWNHDGRTYTE
jgi:hypothetical protein